MKKTVEEAMHVMDAFDSDHSGALNKEQFASFVVNFAVTATVDLVDMLDFMLVVMALKNNSDAEKHYVKTIGNHAPLNHYYG